MSGAFHVAAIGLDAQQRALEVIANNIANVNTPAFRGSGVRFSELVAPGGDVGAVRADLGESPDLPAGVRADPVLTDRQGPLEATGDRLDLAIDGIGFIEAMGPTGQMLLWRGGRLKVGPDGLLSTESGLALKAAITVPLDSHGVTIGSDGLVTATGADGEPIELGRIMLVRTDDPGALRRVDGGYFRADDGVQLLDAEPGEDGAGLLVQGYIERSNIDLTSEMVQMMMVQRAYAANAQIVQAADQLMAIANGLRR